MKIKKEKISILALSLAIIFFAIILVLIIFYSFVIKGGSSNQSLVAPSNVPVNSFIGQAQPLKYDLNGQRKLLEYISSPKTLSQEDLAVRRQLANLLIMDSNAVYVSKDVEIDYLRASGLFQGKILSGNFELAKREAINWLKQQQLSQTGICNLPLMFYVDPNIIDGFRGTSFNPLPPGC
jgi:hypothetical protein